MIATDISPVLKKAEEFIKMDLSEGDICRAFLLKNYEDKIDMTPWRAVRVLMAA